MCTPVCGGSVAFLLLNKRCSKDKMVVNHCTWRSHHAGMTLRHVYHTLFSWPCYDQSLIPVRCQHGQHCFRLSNTNIITSTHHIMVMLPPHSLTLQPGFWMLSPWWATQLCCGGPCSVWLWPVEVCPLFGSSLQFVNALMKSLQRTSVCSAVCLM